MYAKAKKRGPKGPPKLTGRQLHAIRLLATGTRIKQVAEAVEVNVQVVYSWRGKPLFRAALDAALADWDAHIRDERYATARERVRVMASLVDRLRRLIADPEVKAGEAAVTVRALGGALEQIREEVERATAAGRARTWQTTAVREGQVVEGEWRQLPAPQQTEAESLDRVAGQLEVLGQTYGVPGMAWEELVKVLRREVPFPTTGSESSGTKTP